MRIRIKKSQRNYSFFLHCKVKNLKDIPYGWVIFSFLKKVFLHIRKENSYNLKCILMSFIMRIFILCILFIQEVYAQNPTYIRGKNYEGFSFPKEFKLQGFPPASNRYTLSNIEICQAEKILLSNPVYLSMKGKPYKRRKIRLSKYYRQYVAYIEKDTHIFVHIYFIRKAITNKIELSEDLIMILDGGSYYWRIIVDITDKKIISIEVNGYG